MPLISFSQFQKIKTREVSEEIVSVAIDRPGDLYLTSTSGQFQKFDKDGKVQVVHKNNPAPDLFDPRDGARLFAFYRTLRQYAFLDPSFNFLNAYKIDSAFVIDPWLVCASGDFNVWTIDAAAASLKKINPRTGKIEVDTKLDSSLKVTDLTYLREYQGFLFALQKEKGILIFNSMGKLLKTLPVPGITYFNFLGEELYYISNAKVIFFDLFSAESRTIKLPQSCEFALLTDERLYLIEKKIVTFFSSNLK
jgi:hypothetical protein